MKAQEVVIDGPQTWSPEKRGRALHIVWVLANTPPGEWRGKREIHQALEEFKCEIALSPQHRATDT